MRFKILSIFLVRSEAECVEIQNSLNDCRQFAVPRAIILCAWRRKAVPTSVCSVGSFQNWDSAVVIVRERTHVHNAECSAQEAPRFRMSFCGIFSTMCYIRYARLQTVTSPEHIRFPRSCTKLYAVSSYELPSRLLPLLANASTSSFRYFWLCFWF